jgi:transcriptional regulator of heat shock response
MNEYYQKRIISIINRELAIDQKIRVEFSAINKLLPIDKKKNLNLSIETIQNKHFKTILSKIKDEFDQSKISDFDDSLISSLAQNRIDEILELNLTNLSEKEQKEINRNLNIFDEINKNIDKNKY